MTEFTCNLSDQPTPLKHVWEHTLGSGHAALALRGDWQAQLRRCHAELGTQRARFHGILDDDLGTLICENDQFSYSFFNTDQIWDFVLSLGMRPIVELSFMPWTLANGDKTAFHYGAHVTPPRSYGDWATLVRKLVGHWVARYGLAEVREWYFEVWNEPNLTAFWTGRQEDYWTLYRHTAAAIKAVDAELRVGGPVTAGAAWVPEFLDFCEQHNVPADFVSTHFYPTDAFGKPGSDTLSQLAHAPRDVMRDKAQQTHDEARGRPVLYTEWSGSSNPRDPLHDEPYTAAFVTRTLLQVEPFVDCYSYWTFSDLFEENYFPSVPFQGGFGLLNIYGIPKPAYRAYQLLHRLGAERLPVTGAHPTVDAWVVRDGTRLTVLLTNFAFPRHDIAGEQVQITLHDAPEPRAAVIERIDAEHANARRLWHALGEPKYLDALQVARLEEASSLVAVPHSWTFAEGTIQLDVSLPPQAVAAITLDLGPAADGDTP